MKSIRICILATLFLGLLVPGVHAAMQVKVWYNQTMVPDRDPNFSGGVFRAQSVGTPNLPDPSYPDFRTFCIETNEYVNDGATYYVRIAKEAIHGGSGGGNPDPLDFKTAYLYYTYRTNPAALNTLGVTGVGGSFTGTNAEKQIATRWLQQAMWWIEQEDGGVNNDLVALATAADWTNLGPVRVMQLWGDAKFTVPKQDMLLLIPAPVAAMLGVIGLGLVGWVKRRLS